MTTYSIFKTVEGERRFHEAYEHILADWPVPYETIQLPTRFGNTHIMVSGNPDAPPLLLLHGMTINSTMWKDNIQDLSRNYRTYCIDVMGDFGKSVVTRPLQTEADCVQWLQDVLDGLGLSRVNLLGHSMGGWLALHFALNAPERVESLVLLAPVGSIFRIPLQFMFKVYPAMLLPAPHRIRRAWNWFLAKGSSLDEPIWRQVEEAWMHCRVLLKVIPKRFKEAQLRRLEPRTLFLVGDEEVIYNAHKAVERVKAWFPKVETEVIPHASHCLNAEQPAIVNDRILRFLRQS